VGALDEALIARRSDQHEGHRPLLAAKLGDRLQAAEAGHAVVDDDDVEVGVASDLDGIEALRGFGDVHQETGHGQGLAHDRAHRRGIVDHQHAAWQPDSRRGVDESFGRLEIRRLGRERIGRKRRGGPGLGQKHREWRLGRRARRSDEARNLIVAELAVEQDEIDAPGKQAAGAAGTVRLEHFEGHLRGRRGVAEDVAIVLRGGHRHHP